MLAVLADCGQASSSLLLGIGSVLGIGSHSDFQVWALHLLTSMPCALHSGVINTM